MERRKTHGDAWTLPLPQRERHHPLADEISGSVSVGTATNGFLTGQRRMPASAPGVAILKEHQGRNTCWGTDELVELLLNAGKQVAQSLPGGVLMVGNLSVAGGGDMPWSISHNSGRDVDLAYFVLDEKGQPYQPSTLVMLDAKGLGTVDGKSVTFDAKRTWALVNALISQTSAPVQYVFAYEPLIKQMLLEARKSGLKKDQEKAIRLVLRQPRGAQPHADHMHVRIACSKEDLALGCRDIVAGNEVMPTADAGYQRQVKRILHELEQPGGTPERLAALWEALGLLKATVPAGLFETHLAGCSDPLCGALLKAAGGLRKSVAPAALVRIAETSAEFETVQRACQKMQTAGPKAAKAVVGWLTQTREVHKTLGPFNLTLKLAVQAAYILGHAQSKANWAAKALMAGLANPDVEVRKACNWALSVWNAAWFLTPVQVEQGPLPDAEQAYKVWLRSHSKVEGNLRRALEAKGVKVKGKKKLEVVDLLRCVELEDPPSFHAQLLLAEHFKEPRHPDLVHKADARRYWKALWGKAK